MRGHIVGRLTETVDVGSEDGTAYIIALKFTLEEIGDGSKSVLIYGIYSGFCDQIGIERLIGVFPTAFTCGVNKQNA